MIESLYQIDFVDSNGGVTNLLALGDLVDSIPGFMAQQSADTFVSLGSDWGGAIPLGGARRPLTWTRQLTHASHGAVASWCIRHSASLPLTRSGKIRVTISGGETWEMQDAVISSVSSKQDINGIFTSLNTYTCDAGYSVPVAGLAHYAGQYVSWILETHTALAATTHTNM